MSSSFVSESKSNTNFLQDSIGVGGSNIWLY